MKTRVITGIVAALFFIGGLCTVYSPVSIIFSIFLSIGSFLGVYEITSAIGLKNVPMRVLALIIAPVIPILYHFHISYPVGACLTAYVLLQFMLMVLGFEKSRFDTTAITIISSLAVPYGFSVLILFRDLNLTFPDSFTKPSGMFFILFSLFSAWFTDIFALFTGVKFGKHKLCPKISPKKTVEGAVGGVLGALLMNCCLLAVFNKFFLTQSLSFFIIIPVSLLLSVISIFGDLAASTLKRNYGIKDFGNLLPGHGGVLDRFDSCMFVLPALYAVLTVLY